MAITVANQDGTRITAVDSNHSDEVVHCLCATFPQHHHHHHHRHHHFETTKSMLILPENQPDRPIFNGLRQLRQQCRTNSETLYSSFSKFFSLPQPFCRQQLFTKKCYFFVPLLIRFFFIVFLSSFFLSYLQL